VRLRTGYYFASTEGDIMAVTNNGNRFFLTAANDEVTGRLHIQAIAIDHTAAANAVVRDSADKEIITARNTTGTLTQMFNFSPPLVVDGLKLLSISAGRVMVFLA